MNRRGFLANAIAIMQRCRIPPESSCGYCLSVLSGSASLTWLKTSMLSALATFFCRDLASFGAAPDVSCHTPRHPYTQGLMRAIPMIDRRMERLETIPGSVPDLIYPPSGCRFHPRCPFAFEKCKLEKPELLHVGKGHTVACHLYGEGKA